MNTLIEMLGYKRPAYSKTEELFLDAFFRPLAKHANVTKFREDRAGNLIFEVAGGSTTLFCAHADTMHFDEGMCTPMRVKDKLYAVDEDVLGADDGIGCWIVRELILAGTPSTCIITRGEEYQGIGARFIAPKLVGFQRAIAFDRRGQNSVITHQSFARCCSNVFADALIAELAKAKLRYVQDATGTYCDTAEWTWQIPECTNLSCGYKKEHSIYESCSLTFAAKLRDAALSINWSALPVVRKPSHRRRF